MYQIDSSGAVTSLPAPAAPGSPGYFTDGNPATALPATILEADWFNAVMLELLNIVTAAGITPTKGTNNQVLTSLQNLFLTQIGGDARYIKRGAAGTAGIASHIGWTPGGASNDVLTGSFVAPCAGTAVVKSIATTSNVQSTSIGNVATINGVNGAADGLVGSSNVAMSAAVTAGQTVNVSGTLSVTAGTSQGISHWLEWYFIPS